MSLEKNVGLSRKVLAAKKKQGQDQENFPGECRTFMCRNPKAPGSNFCEECFQRKRQSYIREGGPAAPVLPM